MFERSERRSAGSAIVTADENDIGMRLGYAGGYCAHSHFGHQLH
jgi:hypothetical protein